MTSYIQLNGSDLFMPTKHGWIPTDSLGKGGYGQEVLTSIWNYQLQWDVLLASDFSTIYNLYLANINSPITAYLPKLGDANYSFHNYACFINPPVYDTYSDGAYINVATSLIGIDITS